MLQDITPNQLYNQYEPAAVPAPEDYVFVCEDGRFLCKRGSELTFPKVRELLPEAVEGGSLTYLFRVEQERYFLLNSPAAKEAVSPEAGYGPCGLRDLRGDAVVPKHRVFAAYTAKHLADWYRDTRFCGRCGSATVHSDHERAVTCPACGYTAYPRIMPAVIVGVINGDCLLLTRYRTGYGYNALIAGFTEIGETLEETVRREVMEEAGVQVKNIRYYKSQPWGIANDILVGYFCEVDGDDTIRMDESELKYAAWVPREEIALQPDSFSLTGEMMTRFKTGAPV